jgi:hypothetical protein
MPSLDIFDSDPFSLQSLTARANQLPEVPTLIGDLGVFEEDGVTTIVVSVEKQDEGLTLVGSSQRGGPGESVGGNTRNLRSFTVPHFQRNDSVKADEVQGIRAFGTESDVETVLQRVDQKIARHTRSLDFTLENLRLGAINGIILDKDGSVLLDVYAAFGISQPPAVDFLLGSSTTNVRDKCAQVRDAIEDALEGEQVTQVYGLAGNTFFGKLVTHNAVEKTYANWQAAINLRADPRLPFEFGGISWLRYHTKPKAKKARGNQPMIEDSGARFLVKGVSELYITRFAPADYEDTVNTLGLPRYARQYPMPNGKGRELEVQSNPLSMCTRPEALQNATTSS